MVGRANWVLNRWGTYDFGSCCNGDFCRLLMVARGLRDPTVVGAALAMVRLARRCVPASELRAGLAKLLPAETDRQWLREFMDSFVRQVR